MSRWTFWRKRPPEPTAGAAPVQRPQRPADHYWLGEAIPAVLAWLLPSGAVVMSALGQFLLALVFLTLALGIWLRLWRGRKRSRTKNS